MISPGTPRLRITWLCPDDKGGGVVSVAEGCCKQATLAGHKATLLLALAPTGHSSGYGGANLASLDATPPYSDIPARLIAWLAANPQDVLILNGCEQADAAIPYLPANLRVFYGVHDTRERYYRMALLYETYLDGIIAVSDTVASRFRSRINSQGKLFIVHNGTEFPISLEETVALSRNNDLVFLGGDNPLKGAQDILALWPILISFGFGGRLQWFGEIADVTRRQISFLPCSDRIVLHERQPRKQIFDAASRSKVVLMLSRVESFGMATVECMGMGCLVAAWDIETGTKEIAGPSDGVFAPLGNFSSLASGIIQAVDMHNNNFVASTMRIRRDFNETAMWSRYASAIESMLFNPPAKRVRAGQTPPPYRAPMRLFQMLPSSLRERIRNVVGRSPKIGYAMRNLRGR